MSKCIMAKHPRVFSFFLFFPSFFSLSFFFFIYRETRREVHFIWNYIIDKRNTLRFMWNNSISTKFKKVERTLILNPYIKLLGGLSF